MSWLCQHGVNVEEDTCELCRVRLDAEFAAWREARQIRAIRRRNAKPTSNPERTEWQRGYDAGYKAGRRASE